MSKKKKLKKEVRLRHRIWVNIFKIILKPIYCRKYRYHYHKYPQLKNTGPYLILCNHTIAEDPLLIALSFPFQLYYVSTDQIFNLGLVSKLLKHVVNPIPKSKSLSDLSTIKKIKRITNEGGNICMFVEGNVSYNGENPNMPQAVTKLIKHLQIPIIICNTHGLYLSNPRWSINRKYGKSYGELKRIIKPNEYNNWDNDYLYEILKTELYVNCYFDQDNQFIEYHGKDRALGLERLLFMCPNCQTPFAMLTNKNIITCEHCNFSAHYGVDGYLESPKYGKQTLIELDMQLKTNWINYLQNFQGKYLFKDDGDLEISYPTYKKAMGPIIIEVTIDGIEIIGDRFNCRYRYDEIASLAIQGKRKILIYHQSEPTLLITFNESVSPYKYLLTYQYYKIRLREESKNDTIKFYDIGL